MTSQPQPQSAAVPVPGSPENPDLSEVRAYLHAHDLPERGFVIFFLGHPCGWASVLDKPGEWRPGCFARSLEGEQYVAVGGSEASGAAQWKMLCGAGGAALLPVPAPAPATKTARQHLIDLVTWALENGYCSTAATIRSFLLSLYNGSENKCDLSDVQLLDAGQRRAVAAIIIGIGRDGAGNFYDHEIREAFIHVGGEAGLRWFLGKLSKDTVQHMMVSAQRSLERKVAA